MSDFEIRYTRQRPEAWDELLDAIDPDETMTRPVTIDHAQHAMRSAATLETETLETTSYYALGLGMCGIARALHDNERRATLAASIAADLDARNRRMRDFIAHPGPKAFSSMTAVALEPLRALGVESYTVLPAREHLAADALVAALRSRRGGYDMFTYNDQPNMLHTHNVQSGKAAAELIVSNATAGSIITHHHMRKAAAAADNPQDVQQHPVRFAVQSAGLHTEEFQGELYAKLVTYGANGSVELDRTKLPASPELPEKRNTNIKHLGRLGCPAIQVQYAIPGMLDLMLDIEALQG